MFRAELRPAQRLGVNLEPIGAFGFKDTQAQLQGLITPVDCQVNFWHVA